MGERNETVKEWHPKPSPNYTDTNYRDWNV